MPGARSALECGNSVSAFLTQRGGSIVRAETFSQHSRAVAPPATSGTWPTFSPQAVNLCAFSVRSVVKKSIPTCGALEQHALPAIPFV
jgi:hypothetical protein